MGLASSYATYEPVARLLITERLRAVGGAALVEVAVGPVRAGRRSISVAWQDGKVYTNVELTDTRRLLANAGRRKLRRDIHAYIAVC